MFIGRVSKLTFKARNRWNFSSIISNPVEKINYIEFLFNYNRNVRKMFKRNVCCQFWTSVIYCSWNLLCDSLCDFVHTVSTCWSWRILITFCFCAAFRLVLVYVKLHLRRRIKSSYLNVIYFGHFCVINGKLSLRETNYNRFLPPSLLLINLLFVTHLILCFYNREKKNGDSCLG